MTDRITTEQRSINMSKVKGKNTSLEIVVRKRLFKEGFRYRTFYKLPGRPDIVLPSRKAVIFVHGCFWHQHDCKKAALPTSNENFWRNKLTGNKQRDAENQQKLKDLGWNVYVLWECTLNSTDKFEQTMTDLLSDLSSINT
ncbi:very short patch repair endonuclease [candidate division WWE3 bacterium RIFCSPHIGHO2_01_FULL_40_23]|uniref:Very short patch repair endonuclease n=1 Tax=candidate division WWE3 bacterium RIFCSPLOWO2_01_FULL_41_18 TaxID=1802625 RepID=A0A1F4VF20_UNCKA|nr:MAG: very short patch repair endonuclease [candidate division WWE3 bacterium RIFCSPHIGHO2_01_FULL_40_23]OGC55293.1 MAG: very short patch repair endonuclease [candidate division WWE3 bacterium RIFCSPLOWO2_01_FULL_41_18]